MKVIVLLTSGEFCHLPLASNTDADHMCELHDLLHHHPQLPALEHHSGVGGAGVVELAGQQVEADAEWLTRKGTAKTKVRFRGLIEFKLLSYQLLTRYMEEEWVPEKISILKLSSFVVWFQHRLGYLYYPFLRYSFCRFG